MLKPHTNQIKSIIPDDVKAAFRRIYGEVKFQLLAAGDRTGILSPDQIYDAEWFEHMAEDDQLRADSADTVSILHEEFSPETVLDIGCGVALYLLEFRKLGCDIRGVEGSRKAIENALIDARLIENHDLRDPYHPNQTFDLVLCFEVAEHIPARYADTLVKSITRAGDAVVFTAAKPGQGGSHHVNEQPRKYWKDKFAEYGFEYDGDTTARLSGNMTPKKASWISENLFVFVKP